MAPLLKCFMLHKHEDLSLISQNPHQKACNPNTGVAEAGESL